MVCLIHQGTLTLPDLAVGGEDAVAKQRPQRVAQHRVLWECGGLVDHHTAYQCRLVDHVKVDARQVHLPHLHVVAALVQRVQP